MPMPPELVFRRATIYDGQGAPPAVGDLAVTGTRISAMGVVPRGRREIDAPGLALAPGFIDCHTHDDWALTQHQMTPKLSQGVTTVVTGNCGISAAPHVWGRPRPSPVNLHLVAPDHAFPSFAGWFDALNREGIEVNAVCLVGHTMLRAMVMDDLLREATPTEVGTMGCLLDQALADGVAGMSTGLEYEPAGSASTEEIVFLASRVGEQRGVYATHLRDEMDGVLAAMEEAFAIGEQAEVPVLISHHKCSGLANFGRSRDTLALFEAMRGRLDVSLDAYPYDACSTELAMRFVENARQTVVTGSALHPEAAGRDLEELADEWKMTLGGAVAVLSPAQAVYFDMAEEDVRAILAYPHTMIGSDGLPRDARPHPRLWGTFPRVLGRYARDIGLFPLEEAVRRMTSLPAARFGLTDRGVLRVGAMADLVLFDPLTVTDAATFADPIRPALGIHGVWVNGQLVWNGSATTGARPGAVLKPTEPG